MRCNNCSKMVAQDAGDPEVQDIDYVAGKLTATVRIVQVCAECGSDLKEAIFDFDEEVEFCDPATPEHEVDIQHEGENTDAGGGRYKKRLIGVQVDCTLTCKCGKTLQVLLKDDIPAGEMEPV